MHLRTVADDDVVEPAPSRVTGRPPAALRERDQRRRPDGQLQLRHRRDRDAASAWARAAGCRRRSSRASSCCGGRTEQVAALAERHRPRDGARRLDPGRLVHARPDQVEVVLDREVADGDVVRPRVELRHPPAVGMEELDVEVRARPLRAAPVAAIAAGAPPATSRAAAATRTNRPPRRITLTLRAGAPIGFHARSSAPKRSASAVDDPPRISAASSSESVRSGDWNSTPNAIDFLPFADLLAAVDVEHPHARAARARRLARPRRSGRRPRRASSTANARSCFTAGNVITSSYSCSSGTRAASASRSSSK